MNRAPFLACISVGRPREAAIARLAARLEQRHGLTKMVDMPELLVLGDATQAHIRLPQAKGLIWGQLFNRRINATIPADQNAGREPLTPETLLERSWGGYIAMLRSSDRVEVLRDPSGAMACYHAVLGGSHVFTSRPDLLFATGLLGPGIDWTTIAQALVYRDVRGSRTALTGIEELLPGSVLTVQTAHAETRCAWSPWRFACEQAQLRDFPAAVAALRDTTTTVLGAWGGGFDQPLIEISGGLDSAIVAAGIGAANPGARCLTFGPAQGDPDERPWARAVAEHLKLPLHELTLEVDAVDVTRSDAADLPRPCARLFSQGLDRPIQTLAREVGANAFFGGGGGDSIFCLLQSALVVLDRIRAEGIGNGTLETATDIGQLSGTNMWKVLAVALRRALRPPARYPRPATNGFLARHARTALTWPVGNPWLEAPREIAAAKKHHVWTILSIPNHLEGYGREALAPYLSPLMAQPMLETCLAVPSWFWCEGGRNRAIARDAFRDRLPATVIERSTKGAFNRFVTHVLDSNRQKIREMLLDGALAREGLLDRAAVAACITGDLPSHDALSQLMALVDFEAWIASWENRPREARL